MKEFIQVDNATIFPFACVGCGSSKGPFADTLAENAIGRVYLCKLCARRTARLFGFAPGKKLDELQDADNLLVQKQEEIDSLTRDVTAAQMECGRQRNTVHALELALEAAQGRVQQIEHLAAGLERGARELVEAVAPSAVREEATV